MDENTNFDISLQSDIKKILSKGEVEVADINNIINMFDDLDKDFTNDIVGRTKAAISTMFSIENIVKFDHSLITEELLQLITLSGNVTDVEDIGTYNMQTDSIETIISIIGVTLINNYTCTFLIIKQRNIE